MRIRIAIVPRVSVSFFIIFKINCKFNVRAVFKFCKYYVLNGIGQQTYLSLGVRILRFFDVKFVRTAI